MSNKILIGDDTRRLRMLIEQPFLKELEDEGVDFFTASEW